MGVVDMYDNSKANSRIRVKRKNDWGRFLATQWLVFGSLIIW